MAAWWAGSATDFLRTAPATIIGRLAQRLVHTYTINRASQLTAWARTIETLRDALANSPDDWHVLLEYPLLRLERRIDAVLVGANAVLVLEFKTGGLAYTAADIRQTEDYALDLFDFHAESRSHPIIPILIATDAPSKHSGWPLLWHGVTPVLAANAAEFPALLRGIAARLPPTRRALKGAEWEAAPYRPVPTIIEAATSLYRRHGVREIAAARADIGNLTKTAAAISAAIAAAREEHRHTILFITGIPGAGKTLCGLNAVFGADHGAAFLTGNLPLVHVLREALARDAATAGSLRMARQKTKSAIQPLINFIRDNLPRTDSPHEQVIVFDEAQRAWDAAFGHRRFGHAESEAAMMLDIMARHNDWAVIVALVGNGQEINTGEAGLAAWGEALEARPVWRIHAAPTALTTREPRERLFATTPAAVQIDPALHLGVPIRSIRTAAAAPWVDALLRGDKSEAASIAADDPVPFLLTRSLEAMRAYLRRATRGDRRAGLICSAAARRLQADGIWPNFPHLDEAAIANWFLARWPDVRASDALEVPATQFACQGLELDLVGLCWGNDLIRQRGATAWIARSFSGTRWQTRRREADIAYRINTYRVLLTRARYETVIWVPEGDSADQTRSPAEFDAIADFLIRCGARPLAQAHPDIPAAPQPALL